MKDTNQYESPEYSSGFDAIDFGAFREAAFALLGALIAFVVVIGCLAGVVALSNWTG